jgi:Cupredoxin-like domain
MVVRLVAGMVFGLCFCLSNFCFAQSQSSSPQAPNTIVIKDHQFIPQQLSVPARQKLQITVDNQDPTPEEFESFDLDREQVVEGHKKIIVYLGPLAPGQYGYWADYHKSSKGVIIAQ